MYTLSLLDKSPVSAGEDAAGAFRDTINLARRAEDLGYRRFWVAEHHNSPELAGSSPRRWWRGFWRRHPASASVQAA